MIQRPILMSGPMVVKTLEDLKTMTRRVMKPQPKARPGDYFDPIRAKTAEEGSLWTFWTSDHLMRNDLAGSVRGTCHWRCPYGVAGDRLWVRESIYSPHGEGVYYSADDALHPDANWAWTKKRLPSIHMPWGLRRITLEIVKVRVERVQEISAADAIAEGIARDPRGEGNGLVEINQFRELWDSLNAGRGFGWAANPWVWVISFRRLEAKHG